jgi:hypothetical protein
MSTYLLCSTMWMKTFLVVTFKFFNGREWLHAIPANSGIADVCFALHVRKYGWDGSIFCISPFFLVLYCTHGGSWLICVFIHLICQHVDSKYLPFGRQPTVKQLDKLREERIHGGPNFLTWFKEHVNPHLTSILSVTCIMFNHLTYLISS